YVLIPADTGTLSISTTPVNGEVFVAGVSWGIAPQSQVVDIGTYTVTFGDMTGYTTPSAVLATVTKDTVTTATGTYVLIPAPQLVITYTPETVYENDEVTVTVEADEAPVEGVSVYIHDPSEQVQLFRNTDELGTCTFTAYEAGDWWMTASKAEYTDAESVTITVLEKGPITEYDIALSVGWNLISLPLIPDDSDIEVVLTGVEGVESVWAYTAGVDTGVWYSYSPGAPSDLNDMVDGYGYWMSMSASATLTVTGTEMPV
ncbi:unnamed protein product, partial [marine sediment metagenome]